MAEDKPVSIWSHLEDLRKTLMYVLIGIVICVIAGYFVARPVMDFLARPIGGIANLQAIEVTENVSVTMRVALLVGITIATPWIFFQLFSFIGKGLTKKEKRAVLIAVPFATLMFVAGAVFAYYVMLPTSMQFFMDFLQVQTSLRIKSYIDFVTNLIFWIACSFELPVLVFVLARVGLITSKQLLSGWRIAIVVIAVAAAIITPTADPVNMAIFMIPLFALYLLSIGLSAIAVKLRAKSLEKE
ncbi:MAG: twin-arginine translocase subunit TatC [Anaerolineaceae bacterium]